MARIIGPSHLLSLRGIHLPSGVSDVIWSGSIKWSATNQISPCRCTWWPLVKVKWSGRWCIRLKGRGNRFVFQHLCLSKGLGVKNKAAFEIDIKDVCLSTHDWHSRWSLCSFVSTHSHAKHHWLPHSRETDNCFMNLLRYLSKIDKQLLLDQKVSGLWLCRSLNDSSCICLSLEFHKESQRYYKRIMS